MWEYAGMARSETGLKKAIGDIQDLRDDFSKNLLVSGSGERLNAELERAGRTRDFIDFGNCFAEMLWKETSLAAVIFAKSTKPKKGRLRVMTKNLPMPQFGNTRVRVKHLPVTRKTWLLKALS